MFARDFRQKAREALRGHWGIAVGVGFLASLLGAGTTYVSNGGSSNGGGNSGTTGSMGTGNDAVLSNPGIFESGDWSLMDLDGLIPQEYQITFVAIMAAIAFLSFAFMILHFVIGGAITLGYVKFNLNLVDGKPVAVAQLFSEFGRLWKGIGMQVQRFVYIFLWSLLFVIPGIYASYGYAMTPYILLEHPEMSANDAITASKEIMNGNRWRLFCLEISFLGWSFLVVLFTLGIGILWLYPYMQASFAAFYREVSRGKFGEPVQETMYNGYYDDQSNTF